MYCVVWTYAVPPALDELSIRRPFAAVAEAADAFYSPEWMAGVTERWGAAPERADWVVPVVAESSEGTVVGTAMS